LPAPKIIVIKSEFITNLFQNFLRDKDIRIFKKSLLYYLIFRIIRNFLSRNIIINIYNFKIHGSIKKNNTSYFLLKKCEFGDYHEINTLKRFSKYNKIFFIDCGCNYGFYSFHVASLSQENFVLALEASTITSEFFLKNNEINNYKNLSFNNKAISDEDDKEVVFNESENDWESSLTHNNFSSSKSKIVKTCKIDTLVKDYNLKEYILFIKLDIEGNEIKAIRGGTKIIEKFSPIIIIEFSKFIFDNQDNINFLNNFLVNFNYRIYDTNKNEINLSEIIVKINKLTKRHKTIGNYYLIKKNSKEFKLFKMND